MKNGVLVLWNAAVICKMFKTSWSTGKLSMKDDLEDLPRANNSIWSNGRVSSGFSSGSIKTSSIWQERKYYLVSFLGMT